MTHIPTKLHQCLVCAKRHTDWHTDRRR